MPVQKQTPFQDAVYQMLKELEPDPDREGVRDTPKRVEEAFRFYCQGYDQDPGLVLHSCRRCVIRLFLSGPRI